MPIVYSSECAEAEQVDAAQDRQHYRRSLKR
jgi:hypothetical protein